MPDRWLYPSCNTGQKSKGTVEFVIAPSTRPPINAVLINTATPQHLVKSTMHNPATQIIQQSSAPIKAAVICLMLAWIFALLPIPFISFGGMIVFNLATFILAILCISKNSVKSGIGILAGTLIGTPIMYFIGLAILAAEFTHPLNNHDKGDAHHVQNNAIHLPTLSRSPLPTLKCGTYLVCTFKDAMQQKQVTVDAAA